MSLVVGLFLHFLLEFLYFSYLDTNNKNNIKNSKQPRKLLFYVKRVRMIVRKGSVMRM